MTDITIPPATAGTTGWVSSDHGHDNHRQEWLKVADFYGSQADQVVAIGKGELAVEKTAAALGIAIEKTAAATQVAIDNRADQLANQAISNFNGLNVAVEKTAAAMALAAALNTAAIQAQAAECCCEIKELVREEAGKTRELIQSIQASNLAVQLVDTKNELLAYKVAASNVKFS